MEKRFYKPRKEGNGAASRINIRRIDKDKDGKSWEECLCFLQLALQEGFDDKENAKFGWDVPGKNIKLKIGCVDAAKMIACFQGKISEVNIFHEFSGKTSTVKINPAPNRPPFNFYLNASYKGEDGKVIKISHGLVPEDVVVLEEFLKMILMDIN